jgi:hypothetical protein
LKDFYSIIKGNEELLRFVFITGVSKFSRVSIFSDLNNLDDLTTEFKQLQNEGIEGPKLVDRLIELAMENGKNK